MELQTHLKLSRADQQITYDSHLLMLGSCFAEHMADKLSYYQFRTLSNPFGILFHPLAIENLLGRAVEQQNFSKGDIFFANERWKSFEAHSDLSSSDAEGLLKTLNQAVDQTREQLRNASHVIITLGTSWIYELKKTRDAVANCHKVPQKEFDKRLLAVDEVLESLHNMLRMIRQLNNKAEVVFTVSPVRHLKDGFIENQRSKSHLLTAVHQLLDDPSQKRVSYFPAFEIMMDELRDYRFYKADMVHPNELAVNYIWEKFVECWIADSAQPVMDKVAAVQKGLDHKPFNTNSKAYKDFRKSIEAKISYLKQDYPFMQFDQ
ncbi:GSCFA domain-containing protein [Poritiphilus flavus]|uniref:GSCFA domain-containing protein n=1 Tax=Poritiphilus flavus TaxID=2697053 RepID=A0A6L9EJK7_9FLAO|nr:GSCFA domain-containing protein [Poritiphilus flavus]NAS14369.1 GSCFA domain-containing protein [Poritiphilus flavus]